MADIAHDEPMRVTGFSPGRAVLLAVAAAVAVFLVHGIATAGTVLDVARLVLVYAPVFAVASALALFFVHDRSARDVLFQVLTFSLIVALIAFIVANTITNLETNKKTVGYGFLARESRFAIGESLIAFTPASSFGRAVLVGFLNTLQVSLYGIVLATVVGITVGILSLSGNWLVRRVLGGYVSFMRNIPVILHLVLWYSAITTLMPSHRQALQPVPGVFLSQRGLMFPVPIEAPGWWLAGAGLALAVLFSLELGWFARRRMELTGQRIAQAWPTVGLLIGLPLAGWLLGGAPTALSVPELKGFNFRGGADFSPELIAVLTGLTLYTAAYISEITRSGILAVPHGQIEAGRSLGLSEGVVMRKVVLPQALRVIIPPLTSQYLNLTKNSSLSVIIGYPDLVSIANTIMNPTGTEIEMISIIMIVYLTTSLTTSLVMNLYNRSVQLKER